MASIAKLWCQNKGFMLFVGLMLVFRSAVADWNYVPSSSMNPTLFAGDRVLLDKRAYSLRLPFTLHEIARWDSPHAGDVITFDSPEDGTNLIKRVVAVGGDTISMWNNTLTVNGQPVARQLEQEARLVPSEYGLLQEQIWREHLGGKDIEVARLPEQNRLTAFAPVQVPAGHVMVMGDNRDNSRDSRYIGFIDVHRVTGRALRVVASFDPDRFYLPRADRWWLPLHL
ncbi:signal peptidase I [Xylophilus sp. GW821-FHT01B05]